MNDMRALVKKLTLIENANPSKEKNLEVERDPRTKPRKMRREDLPVQALALKKQPKQRTVSGQHGDNPFKDATTLEEELVLAYKKYKMNTK